MAAQKTAPNSGVRTPLRITYQDEVFGIVIVNDNARAFLTDFLVDGILQIVPQYERDETGRARLLGFMLAPGIGNDDATAK